MSKYPKEIMQSEALKNLFDYVQISKNELAEAKEELKLAKEELEKMKIDVEKNKLEIIEIKKLK